jgi:hypothetical protein
LNIITEDETSCFLYNSQPKHVMWVEIQMIHLYKSKGKVTLAYFFDAQVSFTMNLFQKDVLLTKKLCVNPLYVWKNGHKTSGVVCMTTLLHVSHRWSKSTLPNTVTALWHPPYSPDLSLPNFLCFATKKCSERMIWES